MDNKNEFKPFIPADKIVPEFTVTSVILGIILAVIFGAANAYLGLRVGMTVSASIPAAVISMGQTYFQEALTIPMKSSAEDFVWSSSDTSVASVDSKGEVTAHKNGQAVISASTSDGLYTAEYVLDVEKNMIYN